ncbi:TolC family protein [Litoribacter alkaliphilus]|uniref:TolC family protein n=1 Tax=Litoribacter ruber TaxID=702568 RepID=A0AAP2CJS0_9BACT|nr:TolC family protein [Litoribacter alkaliphilus]MBS9525024.1 TolC family protein [Litoribacter alkaliphilus]
MSKLIWVRRFCFAAFLLPTSLFAQETSVFSLEDIVARAKAQSPAALREETVRENRYWEYRLFRADYNPQLRLNGIFPQYQQAFNRVEQPDGSIAFRPVQQNLVDMELGLQQVIAPTGGMISVNSSTSRFDNFFTSPGMPQTQWSGVPVNVRLEQPIFAFNRFKWNRKIAPLRYEESKRDYVEGMEEVSQTAAQLFFNYLVAQVDLEIAEKNLENTEEIYKIEKGRYEIGTTFEDKLLQVELQVLQAKQAMARARLDMETSALGLKSFIGMNEAADLKLILPTDIPDFEVNVGRAIDLAFQNRADALGFERRVLEADANVAEARGSRFQMNLRASYGYNNAALNWAEIYADPNTQALVNMTLSVPVLDWGRNRARMEVSKANKRLVEYTVQQDMINFEEQIFTRVKNFNMLRDRLEITEASDQVADKRYEIARNRYLSGKVNITDLNIAQQEKDANRREFVNSLREYWMAYYQLRQLTLYDFENGQLLYVQDED